MSNYPSCNINDQPKMDCLHCNETKPLTLFKKDKTMFRGRMRMCYDCYNLKYRKPKLIPEKIKHLPGEEWRFVSELRNEFKISNKGRLMSINYKNSGHVGLMEMQLSKGYHRLYIQGKNYSIHRLVCEYFIPNPENKRFVNHINGIKNDNRVENLEWCTSSENAKHSYKIGLANNKGENHSRTSLTNKEVVEIKIMLSKGYSSKDILNKYNLSLKTLSNIRTGSRWSHIKI